VLDLALGRFPSDCNLLAQIAAATLRQAPPGAVDLEAADPAGAAGLMEQREEMLLALLDQHPGFAAAAKQAAAPADEAAAPAEVGSNVRGGAAVYNTLCGHAAALFHGRRYVQAVKFYNAAMGFAQVRDRDACFLVGLVSSRRCVQPPCCINCCAFLTQPFPKLKLHTIKICKPTPSTPPSRSPPTKTLPPQQDPSKAVLCRCLGLCHMALGATDRAAEMVELSEQYSPGQLPTSFMRYKLALDGGDGGAAAAREVERMVGCAGFEPALLQVQRRVVAGLVLGVACCWVRDWCCAPFFKTTSTSQNTNNNQNADSMSRSSHFRQQRCGAPSPDPAACCAGAAVR